MRCECGEEVRGDTCMLCGQRVLQDAESGPQQHRDPNNHQGGVLQDAGHAAPGPAERPADDDSRSGSLGGYALDITHSVRIMDGAGNTIYDIPYGGAKCSTSLGALRIRHAGGRVSIRGAGAKAWMRAISYQQSPPVWYVRGSEDCEITYGGMVLGVTPCIVIPPFSWAAFRRGSYEIIVSRPGATPRKKTIGAVSGTHRVRLDGGRPAERRGNTPAGETLVLNPGRSLVMGDVPHLTDGRGVAILRMPGASASIGFLKRGATISWDEPGLGRLAVDVKCDSGLKYDRLREMLPPAPDGGAATEAPPADHAAPYADHAAAPALARTEASEPQYEEALPAGHAAAPAEQKRPWWRRKPKGGKYNRGTYSGTDLRVTKNDIDTNMGRFNWEAFEAVTANLLASMGYDIEKGYDAKSGRMLGPTKSDMGVDVLAAKGKERVVVQCKFWAGQCGGPDVNKTIGAASVHDGTSVVMVCTGGFTEQAYQIVKESSMPVELWGWETIRKNLRRHLLK